MLRNKMLKVMHGWPMRPSVHHFFGFRAPKLPASQRGRRRVPKGCPGAGEAQIRRGKCEDFAPRNEGIRVSGEGGAKRGRRRAPERAKSGDGNVKILLPETEPQGLAGRGEQREAAAGRP